jgi:hypothetical protein
MRMAERRWRFEGEGDERAVIVGCGEEEKAESSVRIRFVGVREVVEEVLVLDVLDICGGCLLAFVWC